MKAYESLSCEKKNQNTRHVFNKTTGRLYLISDC